MRTKTLLAYLQYAFFVSLTLWTSPIAATTQWEKARHAWGVLWNVVAGRRTSSLSSKQKNRHLPRTQGQLSIIGAGFPRTGTKSIEAALQKLGHRIYDPRAVLRYHHGPRWIQAAQEYKWRNDTTTLQDLLEEIEEAGFTATLDMPLFLFAQPLAALRPDAKVLLSVRDSTEQWYQSFTFINTIFAPLLHCRPWIWLLPDLTFNAPIVELLLNVSTTPMRENPRYVTRVLPWYDRVHTNPLNEEGRQAAWKTAYEEYTKTIEQEIPSDRLLIYNVKQGWKPLLDFLEISEDDETIKDWMAHGFPHVNDRPMLERVRSMLHVTGMGLPLWILTFVSLVLCCVRQIYRLVVGWCGPKMLRKAKLQ